MNTNNDFLGYQHKLTDALQTIQLAQADQRNHAIVEAVFCFGRCLLFGFSTRVASVELLSRETVEPAQSLLEQEIAEWVHMAADLPSQWDATWQDDEAFLLCQSILELRTDAWAAEMALRELECSIIEPLQQTITRFDDALRGQREVLSTVVDSTWWDNQRQLIKAELLQDAWWLNESLSQASSLLVREAAQSMPTSAQWATIRSTALWNEAMPELSGMAAKTETSAVTSQAVYWRSPCQTYRAVLMLPRRMTESDTATPRSLFIMRSDDETLATEFAGQSFSLGTVQGKFDEQAATKVRLIELMTGCNGQLQIGEPAVVWRIEIESNPNSHVETR